MCFPTSQLSCRPASLTSSLHPCCTPCVSTQFCPENELVPDLRTSPIHASKRAAPGGSCPCPSDHLGVVPKEPEIYPPMRYGTPRVATRQPPDSPSSGQRRAWQIMALCCLRPEQRGLSFRDIQRDTRFHRDCHIRPGRPAPPWVVSWNVHQQHHLSSRIDLYGTPASFAAPLRFAAYLSRLFGTEAAFSSRCSSS